jgi:multiple sugar transport system permease protein
MKQGRIGYLFVAPALLHLLVFALFPLLFTLYVSFFRWNLLKEDKQFLALENYAYSFGDSLFWNAMWNSIKFAALSVPLGMLLGLGVALLVNQKLRGVTIFRTLYYIPAISSGVAVAMLWIYMYLPQSGFVNNFLAWMGVDPSTDFLNHEGYALLALVFMAVWVGLGPKMILFVAGLLNIPQSLYEAAELDGATKWQTFRSVTVPMLVPTTFFILVTSTIGSLQLFTPVYMMTHGGPGDATDVAGFHIYNEAWTKFLVGIAGAKSFILLLVIAIFSIFQFKLMKSRLEGYSTT